MANAPHSRHAKDEHDILKYWDENTCFQKSVENRPAGKPYVFYDGPPFATGLPHYGHILQSVIKDAVPRFWTMKGHRVERTWGWDCHGLPIENIVEKQFDLDSRKDIEAFGIEAFNNKCHEAVLTYAGEWKKVIRRLGRWVDMDSAYKTMDMPFMESVWWVFKELWNKDMVYEGLKPMHICPRCETVLSNFEVNLNYREVKDISVYVTFPLTSGAYKGANMVAWTTTPWTLPGNVLVAVDPGIEYVVLEGGNGRYIVAKDRKDELTELAELTERERIKGSDLVGAAYEPLFPFFKDHKNAFRVVGADFVNTDDGTGVVHVAPGFGEDDMRVGETEDVEPILHVGMDGRFVPQVADPLAKAGYEVKGVPVKKENDTTSVDVEILRAVAHNGRLFAKQKITHSYPHCWRCDTPLLNYSTLSWFVKVTDVKNRLVATNKEINWVPEHIRDGRFGKWLEGARDWAVSRSRYWGTPLPIWKSEDGDVMVVGSVEELQELSGKEVDNLHKHVVDNITFEKDGKTYTRIGEVLDCWFESGSMPYAQLHYPFENEEAFERGFPAEFIAEAQDQTRGWFYTLHVLSNILFDMPAYKNVIVSGIVLAEDGKKMSKRLKNYPDPIEMMEKYGSDAVRFYLMSSPLVHAQKLNFNEREVHEVSKKFVNILRNVVTFYELYKEHDDGRKPKNTHVLDRWILSRLNQTLKEEAEELEAYRLDSACRVLQSFVTDLSTWYVRRSRGRFKTLTTPDPSLKRRGGADEDALEALAMLRTVLDTFSKMIAPFTPFLAEHVYQAVDGGFLARDDRLSVHLENWPEPGNTEELTLEQMGEARAIVSRALDIREEAGRPVKQVLSSMTITVPTGEVDEQVLEVIKGEVNVKLADVKKGELAVELDLELTPGLVREGMARDVTRRVNKLRKKAGLTIEDTIKLKIWSPDDEVKRMFEEHGEVIKQGALAASVAFDKNDNAEHTKEFRTGEKDVWIGF